jgi:(R,R)-butanediol dehydrogenase/meso-butanediol dehydrogenase/diacetyl reductase
VRAARFHGREDLRLEEVAEPEPGPGDVKLRVLYTGICGTDVHEYFYGPLFTPGTVPHPLSGVTNPVILGHELCGEVVEVGTQVTGVRVGDLVAAEPLETCGACAACLSGAYNLCPTRAAHGLTRAGGGFSEYTVVTERMAHVLPGSIDPIRGALIEPLTVGMHAARRAGVAPGGTAAVLGAGPIGLGTALAFATLDVRVILSDPSATRRAAAGSLGFEHVLDPAADDAAAAIRELTKGVGADASVDAAGVPAALETALDATRIDGTIAIVAVPLAPVVLDIPRFRKAGAADDERRPGRRRLAGRHREHGRGALPRRRLGEHDRVRRHRPARLRAAPSRRAGQGARRRRRHHRRLT